MQVLRKFGQRAEAVGEHGDELKPEQCLHARQDDARLGEHVLDARAEIGLCVVCHAVTLPLLATSDEELEAKPEEERRGGGRYGQDDGSCVADQSGARHVHVDADAEREGQQREPGDAVGECDQGARIVAAQQDLVIRPWRQQQPDGDQHERQADHLQVLRARWQLGKA